jgi:hypothetical protein
VGSYARKRWALMVRGDTKSRAAISFLLNRLRGLVG